MVDAPRSKAVDLLMQRALRAAAGRGAPEACLAGKRFLVVDDLEGGLKRMLTTLRVVGGVDLEISTARSTSAAIDICLSHDGAFDVVFLNWKLGPVDRGIELLAMLRRAGLPDTVKTVLYSEAMSRGLRKAAMAAGFDDTLHCDDIDGFTLRELLTGFYASAEPPASSGRRGERPGGQSKGGRPRLGRPKD